MGTAEGLHIKGYGKIEAAFKIYIYPPADVVDAGFQKMGTLVAQ